MNLKVLFPKETMTRIQNGTLEVCVMTKDAVTKQITNHFPVIMKGKHSIMITAILMGVGITAIVGLGVYSIYLTNKCKELIDGKNDVDNQSNAIEA